ncbi:hypothetical protein CAPTEDRAFT_176773 [Capitella teleta]|uniref:HotDog ACOT-type domain-containing protein n=1 Tax=Capitella teleta TaxID=283909 RepID=R7V517_CAPTE|nr:hypothetical protein CAPTEDRAFT_176773 [Capitella teleta]|eukprot:ELU13644.1 hypothetical protein CAPTEDRAFT_176773 [Capitella teleta]
MTGDDANLFGFVHGGVILQMVEEAGVILTTRYCNAPSQREHPHFQPSVTALARVERTDFHKPLKVGQVAQVHGEVLFTSPHSIKVRVEVWAEDVFKGTKQLTNQAVLWYVAFSTTPPHPVAQVPQITSPHDQGIHQKELLDYQTLLKARKERSTICEEFEDLSYQVKPQTPAYSESQSIQIVHPSKCTPHMFCRGGWTMYWMDECAGVAAAKHCGSMVVTLGLDAIDFTGRVKMGSVVECTARAVFTSAKTLLLKVIVDVYQMGVEDPLVDKVRAAEAYFRFVALDKEMRARSMPQLKLVTEKEKETFEKYRLEYEAQKHNIMRFSGS